MKSPFGSEKKKSIFFPWRKIAALTMLASCCLGSCNLLQKMVNRVSLKKTLTDARPAIDSLALDGGRNLSAGISENARLISSELVRGLKGVTDTLNPDIRRLMQVIDSIGNLTDAQLIKLGNTLDSQLIRLKGEIKDKSLQTFLDNMVKGITRSLDRDTKLLLSNMVQATLDTLRSPASSQKIAAVLAAALSDSTSLRAQKLISTALQPSIDTIAGKIDAIVHQDIPFIQKQAGRLLWGLGAVAIAIIGYIWYQRRKYSRLLQIMTYHIDKMPIKDQYDQLTQAIQSHAQVENLEPLLRSTLKKQGINS